MSQPHIKINCAAAPYNPLPVIDAAFAQVARIRANSTAPIFILAGEQHNDQIETFLPYVAAHRAGLLGGTTIPQQLATLQFALERPHDTLQKDLTKFKKDLPGLIKPHDRPSVQLARILSFYGNGAGNPQDASRVMLTAFADNNVPLIAVDASIKWGRVFPFLDPKDELTRQFMPDGEPSHHLGFMAGEPRAMHSRNRLMAHLLQQQASAPNALIWMNCGYEHLFDDAKHSVSGLAGLLNGHVLVIANTAHLPASQPATDALIVFSDLADTRNSQTATAHVLRHLRQATPSP